jgi:hypothetical protein
MNNLLEIVKANTVNSQVCLNTDDLGYDQVHAIIKASEPEVLEALKGKEVKVTGH